MQRIAIARALLRNPPILLLDEATAALDNESEMLVNQAIDRLLTESGSRTTIVIAHRLSSIKACDKIVVMERGLVVEQGTHNALINAGGLYASLTKLSETAQSESRKASINQTPSVQDSKQKEDKKVTIQVDINEESTEEDQVEMITQRGCCGRKKQVKKKEKTYPIRLAFRYAAPEKLYFIPALIGSTMVGLSFPLFALLFSNRECLTSLECVH